MTTVVLAAAVIALTSAGLWLAPRAWRAMTVGPAYKAKVLCSIVFGTGRVVDPQHAEEISADSYALMRLFRARVDRDRQAVSASLLGLRPRTALFRADLGATLLPPGAAHTALPRAAQTAGSPTEPDNWASHSRSPRLEDVITSAFVERNPARLHRTRAIVVVRGGELLAERYAPGFGIETRFQGWSMTKSVLNALAGVLVGDGRLSLQDSAVRPEWQAPDARADIRVEDLLRMRSGLKFSEDYADLRSDVIEMLFNQPDAAAYAASLPLQFPVGTTWSYSSGTTNILSAIVRSRVGDAHYFEWPRRALFAPLGMHSAIMEPDSSGTFVCSSFMLATARDWARFGQLYLQDGIWNGRRILPEGWVRFSTTPTPQSPGGIFGAHWWLGLRAELGGESPAAARIPADAFFAVGHEGQVITVIPSRATVVVRLGLSIYIDAWNHAGFIADVLDAL